MIPSQPVLKRSDHLCPYASLVLSLGFVGHGAGLGQQLVDFRIAIAAVVERALAGDELVDIAVGIDPARPAAHQQLEVAALRFVQQRRVFGRSEEHTSELQSLMRISYAVFCLKKKKLLNIRKQHIKTTIINLYTNNNQ